MSCSCQQGMLFVLFLSVVWSRGRHWCFLWFSVCVVVDLAMSAIAMIANNSMLANFIFFVVVSLLLSLGELCLDRSDPSSQLLLTQLFDSPLPTVSDENDAAHCEKQNRRRGTKRETQKVLKYLSNCSRCVFLVFYC